MSFTDKAKNQAEEAEGKAKEFVGDKTNNERMQSEGVREQASANAKQSGEHLKDAARDARDTVTGRS